MKNWWQSILPSNEKEIRCLILFERQHVFFTWKRRLIGFRLSKEDREEFLDKYKSGLMGSMEQ